MPDFQMERNLLASGYDVIAGIDEAGRGPWAGPVVAAAVRFADCALAEAALEGIDDSKKLSSGRRDALFGLIGGIGDVGVGMASVAEIDRLNILEATYLAMARAAAALTNPPDYALVDGNRMPPGLACPGKPVVKGDGRSVSIAAASVIAKVTRDRIMKALDTRHPGYGWARNAGYGTAAHQAALVSLGVTEHHRRSFKPIRKILGEAELETADVD